MIVGAQTRRRVSPSGDDGPGLAGRLPNHNASRTMSGAGRGAERCPLAFHHTDDSRDRALR